MVFIIIFQFQVHLTSLSVSQMAQSPMGTRLDLERRGRVQIKIVMFWTYYFEYKHLLPGAVLIYLTVCANSPPLVWGLVSKLFSWAFSRRFQI